MTVKTPPLLDIQGLTVRFQVRRGMFGRKAGQVKAVEDVSFAIGRGQVVALVGESGSGKTTIGRALLRLIEPSSGSVFYEGEDIMAMSADRLRAMRRKMQIIFQDPFASLNPRMTVRQIVAEGLHIHDQTADPARVTTILEQVGLSGTLGSRYPHEFSGGQRQRIGIARALAVGPEFIVADEPVSALDVSIQAQIINLLQDLRKSLSLTILFIGHDLRVVEYLADTVVVMYLGRLMEIAPVDELYGNPRHPYTESLLSAIPIADPDARKDRIILNGDIPSPINPPSGCVFHTRCPIASKDCQRMVPKLEEVSPGHYKACLNR